MNIAHRLERYAFHHPERIALVFRDRRWTYRELDRAASSVAGGLAGLGLRRGDRVGLHVPNWPEFVIAYYAASKLGLVPLSLNVTYKADEIASIVNDAEAAAVVTADVVAANLPARSALPSVRHVIRVGDAGADVPWASLTGDPDLRAVECDRTDTCAILYTSATTGQPKGVMLTHENVVSNTFATTHHLRMTPDDRGLCALPLFHCFGQYFIMNALVAAGGTLVLQERFLLDDSARPSAPTGSPCCTRCQPCTSSCSAAISGAGTCPRFACASRRRRACPARPSASGRNAPATTSIRAMAWSVPWAGSRRSAEGEIRRSGERGGSMPFDQGIAFQAARYRLVVISTGITRVVAAGPLSQQEVTTLITGSKVTQQDSDPSTSGSQLLEYDAGGKVTRQFMGTKPRGFVETGTWEVNANGQLCVTWQGKAQPNCVYLVPTGRDGYNLTRDPAKTGKMEITGVSK